MVPTTAALVSLVGSAVTWIVQVVLPTSTTPGQLLESVIHWPSGPAGSAVIEAMQAEPDPLPLPALESEHADPLDPPEAPLLATNWTAIAWLRDVEERLIGEAGVVLISPTGLIDACTGTRIDGILVLPNEVMVIRLA